MQRALFVLTTALVIFGLASCDLAGPANDPSTVAKVLTQSAYSGSDAPEGSVMRSIAARSFSLTGADFTGSAYAADIAAGVNAFAVFTAGISFTDQTVVQEEQTYTVDGNLNYAFTLASPGDDQTLVYTAYLYGSGVYVSGPDYEGSVTVDLKETVTFTLTGTTVMMSCVVEGVVGGTTVSETVTFSFEVATSGA